MTVEGEGWQVEGSDLRLRRAIAGGGELSQVEGGDWERSQVEGSVCRSRKEVSGGGERSQIEGSNHRWMGAIAAGGKQSRRVGANADEGE